MPPAVTVTALVRRAGLHQWPAAHEARAYLRAPHRHLFYVRVTMAVTHDDRDVEFHDLAAWVTAALDGRYPAYDYDPTLIDFGASSCEHIATQLARDLNIRDLWPDAVSVSEDDEYTALWTKDTAP